MTRVALQFLFGQACTGEPLFGDNALVHGSRTLARVSGPSIRFRCGVGAKSVPLPRSYGRFLMRTDHRSASRSVADEQNRKDAKQTKCGAQISRAEIKPGVDEVNGDATRKNSPAPAVGPLPIDERSKTERKHPGQGPKTAVRICRKQRGQPRHRITNDFVF
jgi:hypothetical protein